MTISCHQKIKSINQRLWRQKERKIGFRRYCFNGLTKSLESNNLWPPGQRLLVCQCNVPVNAFASFIQWDLAGNTLISVAHWVEQAAQKMTKALSLLAKLVNCSDSTAVHHKYNSAILWGRKQKCRM